MNTSGISTQTAQAYHDTHGYNEIAEHTQSLAEKILKKSISPITGMLLLAAVLSFVSGKGFDGSFILILLVLNVGISVWQERKADTAIQKLNENLAASVKTLRDGSWQAIPSRLLIPGDIIELHSGSVIPADAEAVEAHSASANEAALTGESLPKEKNAGDPLYSGSFIASGVLTARVTAIGNETSFGKTLAKADAAPRRSALERDILRITKFLSIISLVAVAVLTFALLLGNASWLEVLRLDLSLVIAGIPISLPTVISLIIAFGVIALAKKQVIVRQLSSLEELANTDLLLTDKTGTLTQNRITVNEVIAYGAAEAEVRALGAFVALQEPEAALNTAIVQDAQPAQHAVRQYVPADSSRKRATLTFAAGDGKDGAVQTLSLGAPQVIAGLCDLPAALGTKFTADVNRLAEAGYRALALAQAEGTEEEHMTLLGVFALSDELRADAREVVSFLGENGITVVMVTGDNRAIAREISEKLSLPGTEVIARDELVKDGWSAVNAQTFRSAQAFAEILPEDKLALVERARKFYVVASNGDGINDLPAVKAANVGFAVSNAVDALKGAADIVLLSSGIGVIKDAIIEGRKIFERLYAYSLYRISESFRLIVTIVILGIVTGTYPLSPLQLILLALLNDIPIISLAADRVRIGNRPAKLDVRKQFEQSLLYGCVGIVNSLLIYFIAVYFLHLPLPVLETLFFLKLTVSGHLLIYVAHTKERWWRYLPSRTVILATTLTQALATILALTGWLMPAPLPWPLAVFIWLWCIGFMQFGELVKVAHVPHERLRRERYT